MQSATATVSSRRFDPALASRLAASAAAVDGGVMSTAEFFAWLEGQRREQAMQVRRIPFAELSGWNFDAGTGNLRHRSGRFFSVEGLRVESDFGPVREWSQPIINQPEVGILGIAAREIDGVLHLLMQAKSEPGNINGVQLSPTVQATKSNYTRVHGGHAVPYLDCFRSADPRRVVADVLQSEQGSWFLKKRNRNVVVEVGPEVEAADGFCWLTVGQLGVLLAEENLVNMDARTVLSCLPDWRADSAGGSLHSDTELRSWITRRKAAHDVARTRVPLAAAAGWRRDEMAVSHESGRYFSIVAVDVASHLREVPAWSQPLLEPHGVGVSALLVKRIGGELHALVSAQVEPGFVDVLEVGPTVQYTQENYRHLPDADQPPYVAELRAAERSGRILYDTVLSEEGGRFQHARNRYLVIEVAEDFPAACPDDFTWMTPCQLSELLKYSHQVNVQARTLVAALRTR